MKNEWLASSDREFGDLVAGVPPCCVFPVLFLCVAVGNHASSRWS